MKTKKETCWLQTLCPGHVRTFAPFSLLGHEPICYGAFRRLNAGCLARSIASLLGGSRGLSKQVNEVMRHITTLIISLLTDLLSPHDPPSINNLEPGARYPQPYKP